jgi:hypothetical protein
MRFGCGSTKLIIQLLPAGQRTDGQITSQELVACIISFSQLRQTEKCMDLDATSDGTAEILHSNPTSVWLTPIKAGVMAIHLLQFQPVSATSRTNCHSLRRLTLEVLVARPAETRESWQSLFGLAMYPTASNTTYRDPRYRLQDGSYTTAAAAYTGSTAAAAAIARLVTVAAARANLTAPGSAVLFPADPFVTALVNSFYSFYSCPEPPRRSRLCQLVSRPGL